MTSILVETGSTFRFYNCVIQVLYAFIRVFCGFVCYCCCFKFRRPFSVWGKSRLAFQIRRNKLSLKNKLVFWLKIMFICTGTSWSIYNTLKSHHRLGTHLFSRLDVAWHVSRIFFSVFHTLSGVFYSGIVPVRRVSVWYLSVLRGIPGESPPLDFFFFLEHLFK